MNEEKSRERTVPSFLREEIFAIGRHSMVYVVGQALSRAVGFFMIPVYTRFIAPKNYGAMELIEILAATVAMLISMGVADTMSRFYYAEKDPEKRDRIVSTILIGFSLLGFWIVLAFLAAARPISLVVSGERGYRYFLQIAILSVWFGTLCDMGYTYLRMIYKAKLFVSITLLQLVAALSLNIYFIVFRKLDILGVFYSTLITQSLTGIGLCGGILRRIGPRFSWPLLRRLIGFGLPLVPSRIGTMLGFVSNRFFLRWLASPDPSVALAQVGLFSLGHKFGVIINRFVNVPFNSFWGPRRLELLLAGHPESRRTVARVCTYATLASIYAALLLSAGIESVIRIMADPEYWGAERVVPYVALAYVFLGVETHFMTGILCAKKTAWISATGVVSLLLVLVWNYLFIPPFGIVGAATANVAGLFLRVVAFYLISRKFFPIPFELGRLVFLLLTAVILYGLSQGFSFESHLLTFLARTGLVSLFPAVLFPLGFYHAGERAWIREALMEAGKAAAPRVAGRGQGGPEAGSGMRGGRRDP